MSQSNPTGNGCSLEDCYTNLFALTDLCGIKWRKLSADNIYTVDPLDDPVLQSFTRCIQADVLCVWRRVQRPGEQRNNDQLSSRKELWIFWYGEPPTNIENLLAPELAETDNGCWDNGLSYECRSLLFKALHNLIERCLLSKGLVRCGKWFVQPYEHGPVDHDKSAHLSISFSFFLHGESTVCASIDVRQHPPLWRLSLTHLAAIGHAGSQSGAQVLLAPYGMAGILTGVTYKESDHTTQKLLEDWRQFYYLADVNGKESNEPKLPPAVEVIVAGARMRYPTSFVLVPSETEKELTSRLGIGPSTRHHLVPLSLSQTPGRQMGMAGTLTPPTSPSDGSLAIDISCVKTAYSSGYRECHPEPERSVRDPSITSQRLLQKAWQTGSLCPQRPQHGDTNKEDAVANSVGTWDFAEPSQRNPCNCSKSKGKQRNLGLNQKHGVSSSNNRHASKGPDKERGGARRFMTPFHRRSPIADDSQQNDLDIVMAQPITSQQQHQSHSMVVGMKESTVAANSQIVPQLRESSSNTGTSSFDTSLDSPASGAPSPLIVSGVTPSVSHTSDPTMPTLSPHPPAKQGEKEACASGNSNSAESADTGNTSGTTEADSTAQTESQENPNTPSGAAESGTGAAGSMDMYNSVNVKRENLDSAVVGTDNLATHPQSLCTEHNHVEPSGNLWLDSQRNHKDTFTLKRPLLPSSASEESGFMSRDSLYDFSGLNEWLDQPVKKIKIELTIKTEPVCTQHSPGASYHPQYSMLTPSPSEAPHDPYEFSEESSTNAGHFTTSRSFKSSRDDSFPRPTSYKQENRRNSNGSFGAVDEKGGDADVESPATPGGTGGVGASLTHEKDLMPTAHDLDKLFDTSDEENSDLDEFQASASPGGQKGNEDGNSKTANSGGHTNNALEGPSATELSRMFPTPPSNIVPSPGTTTEVITEVTTLEPHSGVKQEVVTPVSSPENSSSDCLHVFTPPSLAIIPGSLKYAPVELPSAVLSPVTFSVDAVYKPWHYHSLPGIGKHARPHSHYSNMPSIEHVGGIQRGPMDRIATSPAMFHGSSTQQRTPMSYELQSPASNASSYLNRNINSVDQGTNSQLPEVHSAVVNVALSESVLNLFKDHNFDSCNICVCNMNINGEDIGLYLPDPNNSASQDYRCTCGFSAITNRRNAYNSGLFYEDEVEITGIRNDRLERHKPSLLAIANGGSMDVKDVGGREILPADILTLLQQQFSLPFLSPAISHHSWRVKSQPLMEHHTELINMLDVHDGCEACYNALEQGRQAMDNCTSVRLEDPALKATCLHKWCYSQTTAKTPTNSQDVNRMLKSLQPLLQDAIQKKRTTRLWEATYTIGGPLTWKDFHLLAGRGQDEACEPQPIPPLLVGHDKESLSLSPHTVRFWDKLLLEPYSKPRDIAYVVVAPDNDFLLNHVTTYFKELSTTYERCRLGRHVPFSKKLRDGIIRVGRKAAKSLADEAVNEWFKKLGDSPVAAKLRLYAQVCQHNLAPFLASENLDKTFFEQTPRPAMPQPAKQDSGSMPHPPNSEDQSHISSSANSTNSNQQNHSDDKDGSFNHENSKEIGLSYQDVDPEPDSGDSPAVVVYIVEPFSYHRDWDDMRRLATLGLMRCFSSMLSGLPESLRSNIHLQVVPLPCVLDRSQITDSHFMKMQAFSVFTQARRSLTYNIIGRSMTGFGTASLAEELLKNSDVGKPTKLFSPPFILAPQKDTQSLLAEACGERAERSGLLLCGYCLSEDQRWLLGAVTDDRGEIMETCTINIHIPNRNRRRKASARKIGLAKLFDFLIGVMSNTTKPWRLVVGRFGRIGHGELKGWAGLLGRKSLMRASKQLRDSCTQCSLLSTVEIPSILSACLVSIELHPTFHILTDQVKAEERMSSQCKLSTPRDASTTHILVFPTSAIAQANAPHFPQDTHMDIGVDLGDEDPLFTDLKDDLNIDQDLNSFFGLADSPVGSPTGAGGGISVAGSPTMGGGGRHSPSQTAGAGKCAAQDSVSDPQEEPPNLLQQPLAMGYYVSTAQTGPLPRWFYHAAPHKENSCPTCFKSILHVHSPSVQQNQDELIQTNHSRHSHPLDSNLTCDVLRYVLETYNALSWLSIDPSINDRRSCLPAHFVVLMQLYHAMNTFV